ncbi:MAG TPA: lipopolysaccharide heptosyltransferase I [Gammaproteobacteria bacterium]|nr:lipopolysaccharide heptosyltransferase I [Gammaproteobacteria bacterium]
MRNILIVKTSSLGDIIHTLPALSDAKKHYPEVSFDWVVEDAFQEVPAWHPAVKRIIPVALRRWRKNGLDALKNGEIQTFIKGLRQQKYDAIIDAQGLLKSVPLAILARGDHRIGLSWRSAREGLASLFYQKRVVVPWEEHAVKRARSLFAKGLDYSVPDTAADYGIDLSRLPDLQTQNPYYVFLHGTTWATKHWPEAYWIVLAKNIVDAGFGVQLLWGNETERLRANRIQCAVPQIVVASRKHTLSEISAVLAGAQGVITVDTGLGHLAAALGVPTVSLYGPSDPTQSGTLGLNQIHVGADFKCAPCFKRVCTYTGEKRVEPACFASLTPEKVLSYLRPAKSGAGV